MSKISGICLVLFGLLSPAQAEWIQIPLVTATQRANGSTGGEGCQVLESLTTDSTGNVLFASTDVGGLLRSRNAGVNWEPVNVGFNARGATYIAVDPRNSDRVLASGSNGSNTAAIALVSNGLYLSTNQGESWSAVLSDPNAITKPYRDLIAYDPTSYSTTLGYTQVVYWSSPGAAGQLFKSADGGANWAPVASTFPPGTVTGLSNCTLRVDANGVLYAGHPTGIYRSTDQGLNFDLLVPCETAPLKGMDLVDTAKIYYNTSSAVYVYDTATRVSTQMPSAGLPLGKLAMVKVSPVNQRNLAIFAGDTNPICYSTDGGDTWARSAYDNRKSFIPDNSNQQGHATAWHPTEADTIYGFSWGFIIKSVDAGKNYTWTNQGYTGVMHSGFFNFNVFDPNLLLITSQDYNSALTTDGGTTWKYLNVAKTGWGGYQYGGYALSSGPNGRMYAGNSEYWNGPRTLRVSTDGGTTWNSLGLVGNTNDAAIGDPTNPDIAFWDQYRTTNGMATGTAADWSVMTGCTGVTTYDPVSKALYGRNNNTLVRSVDHGATWTPLATVNDSINDLAYDHVRNRIYAASTNRRLFMVDVGRTDVIEITGRLPLDQRGNRAAMTVAVDPSDPDVVYIGNHADLYLSSVAVARSIDGGVTWTNLTVEPGETGLDGGREPWSMRVHPTSRRLYVGTECFGTWAYPQPANKALTYEAENLTIAAQSAATAAPLVLTSASNGRVLALNTTGVGSSVTVALPGCEATTYNLSYVVRRYGNPGGPGIFQVAIGDSAAGPFTNLGGTVNYYDATPKTSVVNLGPVTFATAGTKYLRFTCTGRSGGEGFNARIDAIVLNSVVQNQPPGIALTANATSATGAFNHLTPITFAATASVNGATITSVQFYAGTTLLNTDIAAPFTYVWNNPSPGPYAFTAKATASNGLTTTSAAVNRTVVLAQPPVVALTSPAQGASLIGGVPLTLTADATVPDGAIKRVEFYDGVTLLGTDTTAPYSYDWSGPTLGPRTLTARAYGTNTLTATSAQVAVTFTRAVPPTNGLVGFWKLNETSGATAADSSGASILRPLALPSPANTPWLSSGKFAGALDFDGTSNSRATFTSPALPAFTFSGWVRLDANGTGSYPRLLALGGAYVSVRGDYRLVGLGSLRSATAGDWYGSGATIALNTWYHIVVSYDASSTSNLPAFYVNGVKLTTTTLASPVGTATTSAGTGYLGNRADGLRPLDGRLDHVRLYDRVLTDSEVTLLYGDDGLEAPVITTQPVSVTVTAGTGAGFTVAASGTPTLQWQRQNSGSTTWTNISGATNATYAFTPATTDTGAKFRAIATNIVSSATSNAALLTVTSPPASALETWRTTRFTTAQLANPAISGPTADPDGDDLPNLLEYALARDPLAPESEPHVRITNIAPSLAIEFLRARSDLTYTVEASSDLATWEVIATNPGAVSATVPVTVTDPVPASPTTLRRFLRLHVNAP